MSECQQENQEYLEENVDLEGRQDAKTGYCPRKDQEVLLVSSRCFCPERNHDCAGCVFDVDFVYVRLILIMSEILKTRS